MQYKGHLSNISENTREPVEEILCCTAHASAVMTAVNDEGGQVNVARDGAEEDTIPHVMQRYAARSEPWMLMVDDNCEHR